MACAKAVDPYIVKTGPYAGEDVLVDGPEYENAAGLGSNCGIFDPDYIIEANFYCDTYGMDTISWSTMMAFIMESYEAGVLNKERTGGLELNFGNTEAAIELLHQVARGEGFGKIAGLGIRKMTEYFIREFGADPQFLQDIGMENKGLEYSEYVSKESLAQQGGFAMTNKGPQHDEAWLIFMDMVNNQLPTFEAKAEALYYFPLWRTWFGLYGLCKLVWNDVMPADNFKESEPAKVPGHVRNYLAAVESMLGTTGMDEHRMLEQSARVYNLQRLMSNLYGKAGAVHDLPPYRAVGPVTPEEYESRATRYDAQLATQVGFDPAGRTTEEKMAALRAHREAQYLALQKVVYQRRGWTDDGLPTRARLEELGIAIPEVLALLPDQGDARP